MRNVLLYLYIILFKKLFYNFFVSALLLDIVNGTYNPSEDIMSTLSHYFDYSGLNNPFNKIYITSKFDENHSVTIFVFAIAHFSKLFLLRQLGKIFLIFNLLFLK